ncbi:GNAT family N-acetyltransferase [Cellulomonas fimi]|uniref:GNAT family N-acetyltransferase n=1 Tax=Cellulomonas fimi TaxID=1708 RepID=UPI00234D4682|nr:GNAT family N-acetyltransferase [Cellulomonas fimi]MDC7122261.1 GNAT family N-acetyltransferase [Cellulomonas fimi]
MEHDGGQERAGTAADVTETTLADLTPAEVEDVYARLLAPTFRPEELMSLGEVRATFTGPDAQPSDVVLADGRPVGVMLGTWYADRRALLLTYLALDPSSRGLGLGGRLLREVLPRWAAASPGALVLAEVDDPRVWAADATQGDPVARLRFYGRHGARLVPLPYVQPSLSPGAPRVDGMLLLRLDATPGLTGDALAAFLADYYAEAEGPGAVADAQVVRLLDAARALDLDALWPVDRWADVAR